MTRVMVVRRQLARKSLVLLLLLWVSSACLRGQALDTTDYFPLKVGNAWTYFSFEQAPYYYLALRSITGTQLFRDTLYYVFDKNLYTYYRKDSLGNVYVRLDTVEQLLYKTTANIGDSWKVMRRLNNTTLNYTVSLIQRSEDIITLAGVFHNCMRFLFETSDVTEGTYYAWLAPGIGEVRRDGFGLSINYVLKKGEINNNAISFHVFHVFSTTPKSEEDHVDTASDITFFLNTIPPESIPDSDIVIRSQKQGIVPGKLKTSSDRWSFIFTAEMNFAEADTITVTLFARIIDAVGDSLDGNFNWKYEASPMDDYRWRFFTGTVSDVEKNPLQPTDFQVYQNYPNPFNSETSVEYSLPTKGVVDIEVYDALGRQVRTLLLQEQESGRHHVVWDARDDSGETVASGVYLVRLEWNGRNQTIHTIYLK